MTKLINFLLFILLIFLGFYGYNFYQDLPLEERKLTINFQQELPETINTSSTLEQFAPNMRFNTSKLSYHFLGECTSDRKISMKKAFTMITEKTQIINFYEIQDLIQESDIIITCSESSKEIDSEEKTKRTFIAGEGGPTKFLELSPYSLILQGEIQLYSSKYQTKCSDPLVELHELLHVFGYNHINDKTSILYPYLSCDQEFKQSIVQDLIGLYSESAKAELSIANISASKSGKYLNFYVELRNNGLISANNVSLEVSAENRLVKSFEIEELSPGLMRSLQLTNLPLPSNRVENVSFRIKSNIPEYYLENNLIEMSIQE